MLNEDGGKERARDGVDLLSQDGFMRHGREVTGVLTGGTETLNGKREHDPKLSLGCRDFRGYFTETIAWNMEYRLRLSGTLNIEREKRF